LRHGLRPNKPQIVAPFDVNTIPKGILGFVPLWYVALQTGIVALKAGD